MMPFIFLALISILSSPIGYCFDLSINEKSFTSAENDRRASFKIYKQFANELHAQLKDHPHPTKVHHPIFAFLAKHLLSMAQKNKHITWEADIFKKFHREIFDAKAHEETNYEWFIYFIDRSTILLTHPEDRKDKSGFVFNTDFDFFKFSLMSDDDWKDQEKYKLKVKNTYKNVQKNYGFIELINQFPDVVITPYPYELDIEELLEAELAPDQHFAPAGFVSEHVDADGVSMPPAIFFTHDIQYISAAVGGLCAFGLRMKVPTDDSVVKTLNLKKVATAKKVILPMRSLYFRTARLIKKVLSMQKQSIQNHPVSDKSLTSYQANTFFAFLILHKGWNNALAKMSILFEKDELSALLKNSEYELNDKKYFTPILPDKIKGLRIDLKLKVLHSYLAEFYLLLDSIPEFTELQKEFFVLQREFLHINEFIFDNNSWKNFPLFVDAAKPLSWLNFINNPSLSALNRGNSKKKLTLSQTIDPRFFSRHGEVFGPYGAVMSQNNFFLEPHYVLQNSDCLYLVLFHCAKPFETKAIGSRDVVIDHYIINDEGRKRSKEEEYELALQFAVNNHDINAVRELLALGAKVNTIDNDSGNTLLHVASNNNCLEIVTLLVEKGAELNTMNKMGWTPINLAAKHGWFDIVKFLHKRGADLEMTIKDGITPVFSAALGGHLDTLKYLIESKAKKDIISRDNHTLLHMAAISGDLGSVKYLINEDVDNNKLDKYKGLPFHYAVVYGNLSVVQFFVEELQVAINQADWLKCTALHRAADNGDLEMIEYLESQGGDKYSGGNWTPLHVAVEAGHLDVVKHFIAHETSEDRLIKESKNLLKLAARRGRFEVMLYLLEVLPSQGKDPVSRGELLRLGARANSLDIVKYFLDKGVSINRRNKKGETPLDFAKKSKRGNEVEKYLIRQGAR